MKVIITTKEDAAKQAATDPISEAAARAVAVACASVRTPTNTLGFLFYGAAAAAYDQLGLAQKQDSYDQAATQELAMALQSLQERAVEHEENPVKIDWNC